MNDGYIIPLFVSGTLLLVLFAFFIIAYLLIQKHKQNSYQMERSRMIYDHQNKILLTRVEEQESTMAQMSKEIHDNIGQVLSFTKMNMFAIGRLAASSDQAALIEKTKGLLDQLIADIHNISHNLNSAFIKGRGLVVVLQEELDTINFSQGINCRIDINGKQKTFNPEKELLIYRIAQEAVHNITKHAKAGEIVITLSYDDNLFTMCIRDNGVGFEKSKIYSLNGIGFLNMLQRAKLLEGSLDIQSEPGKGSSITLRVNDLEEAVIDENLSSLEILKRELGL